MRRDLVFTLGMIWAACGAACSGDASEAGSAGQGTAGDDSRGGAGAMSTAGSPPSGSGGAGSGAAGGGAGATAGGSGGSAGASGSSGSSGAFTKMGVCGRRGMSTVNPTSFMGTEEFYIIGDRGFGEDICVIKFDVERVGEAPAGCDDPTADVECVWTHQVEYSNPMKVTDVDGVCANSQLALDMAKLDEIDGSRASYGYVSEFAGHNSVLMFYDESKAKWDAFGNATFDDATGSLRFDRREGICNY